MYAHLLSSAFTYLHLSSFPTICHNLPSSSFHLASSDFISFICLYWPPPTHLQSSTYIRHHLHASAFICFHFTFICPRLPSCIISSLSIRLHLPLSVFICRDHPSFPFIALRFIFLRIPLYVFICLHVPSFAFVYAFINIHPLPLSAFLCLHFPSPSSFALSAIISFHLPSFTFIRPSFAFISFHLPPSSFISHHLMLSAFILSASIYPIK